MRNNSNTESFFKRQGFYIALYGSLAVVLVLAAVISFDNLNNTNRPLAANDANQEIVGFEQTSNSTTKSYLTPEDKAISIETDTYVPEVSRTENATLLEPEKALETAANATAKPSASPAATPGTTSVKPEASTKPVTTAKPDASAKPQANATEPPKASAKPEDTKKVGEAEEAGQALVAEAEEPTEPVFNAFSGEKKMSWPVAGDIVMNYSTDHVIYDKTLEQYRTNDNICISAELGAQVKAATEGVVKSVTKTRQKGNTVVIDNGNGWSTVYSELQDGVLVKEGDVVKAGQVIGGVGNPSLYSVLLGNHLSFSVLKNDKPIDPVSVLEKN